MLGAAGPPRRALTARPRSWQPRLLRPHRAAAVVKLQAVTTASSAASLAIGAATAPLLAAGQPRRATPRSGSLSAGPSQQSRRLPGFVRFSRCVELRKRHFCMLTSAPASSRSPSRRRKARLQRSHATAFAAASLATLRKRARPRVARRAERRIV